VGKPKPPRDLEALLKTKGQAHTAKGPKVSHPTGFEPGVKFDIDAGKGSAVAVIGPGESVEDIEWGALLQELGLGGIAKFVRVTHVRAWNSGDKVCHYVRADVGKDNGKARADVEELVKLVHERKIPRVPKSRRTADAALVVGLADWQTGGRDGDGVKGLVARVWQTIDGVGKRLRTLAASGIKVKRLVVCGLGDLVEGCDGFYASQTFSVELDRREQCKVVRALLFEAVSAWAPLVREMVVTTVPGNHGENRKSGKAFTKFGDNDDVAVVEQLAEVCAQSRSLKHVSFVIPDQELTVTLDVCGVPLALAHGHQVRRGGKDKIIGWWKDMAHAGEPVGSCKVLLTGHYHHLRVVQSGHKTHMQCPSLDGGSDWYRHSGGAVSPPGTLTFVMGSACGPMGWSDLQVI